MPSAAYEAGSSTTGRAVNEVRPLSAERGFAVLDRPGIRPRTLADVSAYAAAEDTTLRIDATETQARRLKAHCPGLRETYGETHRTTTGPVSDRVTKRRTRPRPNRGLLRITHQSSRQVNTISISRGPARRSYVHTRGRLRSGSADDAVTSPLRGVAVGGAMTRPWRSIRNPLSSNRAVTISPQDCTPT